MDTHSEELAKARVVRLARFALCVFEVLCKPEANDFEHAIEGFIGGTDADEGVGSVEVGPVFEVRGWFEQLGRQRESNGSEIRDTDKPEASRRMSAMMLPSSGRRSSKGLRSSARTWMKSAWSEGRAG